ncbi:MAG TPA: hypothetical protein VFB68_00810 [Xanthobacteraceae bacterium]|nr:hypothetical protein [Xanthobacteraceae bacterium]
MAKKPKAANRRKEGKSKPVAGSVDLLERHVRALDQHAEALRDHTKLLRKIYPSQDRHALALNTLVSTVTASRTITKSTIKGVLAERWGVHNPDDVHENEPISNYIVGGPSIVMSYWSTLNSLPRFSADHLSMTRADMVGVNNVERMIRAVGAGYTRLGWVVKP